MVRFNDYMVVKRHEGEVFDPFATNTSGGQDVTERTIYDGECKVRITSGYNLSDKLKKANYTISIPCAPDELPEMINERDSVYLTMAGYTEPVKGTVIEFKTYERNCIMYMMLVKDGKEDTEENTGDNGNDSE